MRLVLVAAVVVVVGGGGCDTVFGLHHLPDAGPPADLPPVALHDEDKDGLADATDPCPVDPGMALPDTDGDGLPDLCDPAPGTTGDRITLFDPYAVDHLAWVATGAVTQGADDIELATGASVRYAMTFHQPVAQIHVNGQELVTGSSIGVYVGTGSSSAPIDGLECDSTWDALLQMTELRAVTWSAGSAVDTMLQPATTSTFFTIAANPSTGTCTGVFGTSTVTVTVPVSTFASPVSASIATGANNGATIRSTIVYDR